MTRRSDEVQASMHTKIDFVNTTRLLLLQHVRLMLVVQEFDDWHPGIAVVHIVSKTRGIDDSQADWECQYRNLHIYDISLLTLEELLLELSLGNLDFNSLVHLLGMSAPVIGIILDGG